MRAIMTCLMLVLVLAFAAPPCKSATNDESFIEGAKKEGTLVLYTSMTVDQSQKILDAFRAKYPFIQPKMFRAVGERLLTKIMTEAQAGKYDFDVVQSVES